MEQQSLGAWRLWKDAAGYFRGNWKLVLLTLFGLGVAGVIHPVIGLAVFSYAQYELSYSILAERDVLPGGYGRRRFFAVLGCSWCCGLSSRLAGRCLSSPASI